MIVCVLCDRVCVCVYVYVCVCVCVLSGALSGCSVNMAASSIAAPSGVYGFTVDGPYAWVSAYNKGLVRCAYSAGGSPAPSQLALQRRGWPRPPSRAH